MKISTNQSLQHLNTFGLAVTASRLFEPDSAEELAGFFADDYKGEPFILLGEGSNTLFTGDYDGLVIHPCMKGVTILDETDEHVLVEVGAGENWDSFVQFAVDHEWYGVENLSLIPGSVGSVPVQNIGAYGAEAGECIHQVRVFDIAGCCHATITGKDCRFGYRSSIFKQPDHQNLVVISVTFRLGRQPHFSLEYGDVRSRFARLGSPSLKNLRQTIIDIRLEKLPDPAVTGNAGSFFKNPVLNQTDSTDMQKEWPDMPGYPADDRTVKVPAAWLIQQCGWKGFRNQDAGCWPGQPLVLVNYGCASGRQILELSEDIARSVKMKFGIVLEREVRVI